MYNEVQFIAHCIHTAPELEESSGKKKQKYLGMSNPENDIKERIQLVALMLMEAFKKAEEDSDVLKILMMPEFFFRGKEGAYSMDNVQLIIESLQKLVMDEKKWKDWIFVFGSILGVSFATKENKSSKPGEERWIIDKSKNIEVYNFVLVQKGGFGNKKDAGSKAARTVLKEYKSTIDFIDSGSGFVSKNVEYLNRLKEGSENKIHDYDGNSVFNIDGITFGLEICLDHSEQRLKNSKDLSKIDIQLIPSCGKTIKENAIVSREGGYVFHCDGNGNGSQLLKVLNNNSFENITSNLVNVTTGIEIGKIYTEDAGELHIYPQQDIDGGEDSVLGKRKKPDSQSDIPCEGEHPQKKPKLQKPEVTKALGRM